MRLVKAMQFRLHSIQWRALAVPRPDLSPEWHRTRQSEECAVCIVTRRDLAPWKCPGFPLARALVLTDFLSEVNALVYLRRPERCQDLARVIIRSQAS